MRKHLTKLATFGVAVLVLLAYHTIDFNTIRNWVAGTPIIVSSTTRGQAAEYLAGELLRLSLGSVRTPRVVWLFDDEHVVVGAVEAQYAFPFEETAPSGQARDRRIDAFFKSGDSYKTATTLVRMRNIKYSATANVEQSQMVLTAPAEFATGWFLKSASLASFGDGRFTAHEPLPSKMVGDVAQFIATPSDTRVAFGCDDPGSCNAIIRDNRAWASFLFVNKTTGTTLTVAKQLELAPKQ